MDLMEVMDELRAEQVCEENAELIEWYDTYPYYMDGYVT
jgi:hypothetical protein